ncbi:MAG TPA: YggU family protein [Gammaproteobacteria bacterium]|nr:YggU family protein [Gammaproteobacteria bacterium]
MSCKIQPESREWKFVGVAGDTAEIHLIAAPINRKANKKLVRILSKQFQTNQSDIIIVTGHTSRLKRVRIRRPLTILASPTFIQDAQHSC